MKIIATLFAVPAVMTLAAQVPNNSFENWTAGEPDNWQTSNNNTANIINVTQVNNAHGGSYALRMDTWTSQNFWFSPVIACPQTGTYFPVSGAAPVFTGWYISNFVGGDKLSVTEAMEQNGNGVGGGTLDITNNTSVYQQFSIPLMYSPSNAVPDSAAIGMAIYTSNDNAIGLHQGSYVILDDLQLLPTGISEPAAVTSIENIYPNPANGTSWVEYSLTNAADVSLGVFDVNGNCVQSLVNLQQSPGRFRVAVETATLASGIYILRLQTGDACVTKKLLVR